MVSAGIRQYRNLALEFLGYMLLMFGIGWLMVMIVAVRPQANAVAYIALSIGTGLLCGRHAFRMFRRYCLARRLAAERKAMERPRHWSDRIAAAETVRVREALRAQLGVENVSPALQAIRLRIAERMAREDREREEFERAEREELDRARIERARILRIKAETLQRSR